MDKTTLEIMDRVSAEAEQPIGAKTPPTLYKPLDASFTSAVQWSEGDALYLGTQGFPGSIFRIGLSSFEVEGITHMGTDEPQVSALQLLPNDVDEEPPFLVAIVRAVPSKVVLFRVKGMELERLDELTLEQEENFARGASFNTVTERLAVLSDSVPPHLTEVTVDKAHGTLRRSAPNNKVALPLALPGGDDLTDLTMVCRSLNFGDRLFAGTHDQVLRINTTFARAERERYAASPASYTSSMDMLERVVLPAGHERSRSCMHDSVLDRLYVVTKKGLVVYNTAALGQTHGGICKYEVAGNGLHAVGYDRYNGVVYAAAAAADEGVVMHALGAIPPPELVGVQPKECPTGSGRALVLAGRNFADLFGAPPQVEFALVGGEGAGEPLRFDGLLHPGMPSWAGAMSLDLPGALQAGKYKVRVVEYGDVLVSDTVTFTLYDEPSLAKVTPGLIKASGGALVTVTGSGFVDTGDLLADFFCGGQHISAEAAFVSATSVTFRSPALSEPCTAVVRVSLNGGEDWGNQYVGHVQVVKVGLTGAVPNVMLLKGDADFKIGGSGFMEKDDVVVQFKRRAVVGTGHTGAPQNVSVFFDDALEFAEGKTPRFVAAGVYSLDMFMDGVKVTEAPITLQVVNMSVAALTTRTASVRGGIDVGIRGKGMPRFDEPLTVKLTPAAGGATVEVGAEANEAGTLATFKLPALQSGEYRLDVWISASEFVTVPERLTVYASLPFAWSEDSSCALSGARNHLVLGADDSSSPDFALEAVNLLTHKALHPAVKCVATGTPKAGMYLEPGAVAPASFFSSAFPVTASVVKAVGHDVDGGLDPAALVNVSLKFPSAGESHYCFLTLNGQEWHMLRGEVYAYTFAPAVLRPSRGPVGGNTAVVLEGTGHLDSCSRKDPQVRFSSGNVTSEVQTVDAKIYIGDAPSYLPTLKFHTPAVKHRGATDVEVTIDHNNWIPMQKILPNDNFLYYDATFLVVSPSMVSSAGGTSIGLIGTHFPNTGQIIIRFLSKYSPSDISQQVMVEGTWESTAKISFVAPQLITGDTGLLEYRLDVSFNNQDWYNVSTRMLQVYEHTEETQLGFAPVAGPTSGDTPLSLTLRYGLELEEKKLKVKFVCPDHSGTVELTSAPELGTGAGSSRLATYTLATPTMKTACAAGIHVARNGHDFHDTGHKFSFYRVDSDQLVFSPAMLVFNTTSQVIGTGFVDTGDEMALRLTNAASAAPTNYISAELRYVDSTMLQVVVPDCTTLFGQSETQPRVKIELTINGKQWITFPADYPYSA